MLFLPLHFTNSAVCCWLDCRIGFSLESTTYCVIIEQGTHSAHPHFGLWALGADFGRSEIGLMESRVATDWAHRDRGSQNGTKESTRQSKLRSMMLREYYLLFPSGHQQESHKTSWIGYVFQSMGIREHVVICSAIRNSRINSAFPNGGCHMWRQQRKGRDSRKTKIASQSIVRFCWQKMRE